MEWWIICALIGSIALALAAIFALQRALRAGEDFEPLEADVVDDVSSFAAGGSGVFGRGQAQAGKPLQFRYVVHGLQRLGQCTNPWDLPAVPKLLNHGKLRVWYSPARDEAFLDCRRSLIGPKRPALFGLACWALAGILL